MKKFLSKFCNTYFLIFCIMLAVTALTWVIPSGEYDRIEQDGRTIAVAGSYHAVAASPQGLGQALQAPIQGFHQCAEIIAFILVVGALFTVIERTGAVSTVVKKVSFYFAKHPKHRIFFIPTCMFLFSLCGAVFGMEEETLIFIPIFIPLALSLGYDTLVGMAIPFIGAFTGFSSAFVNPFTVGIAQTIAQLPMYSGWQYRVLVWFIFTSVIAAFFTWYGEKIRKHPSKSLTCKMDVVRRAELNIVNDVVVDESFRLTRAHKLVLLAFLIGMGVLFYGIIKYQWYMTEIAAVFLGVTIAAAYFGKLKLDQTTDAILAGAQSMIGVCILMALARSIVIIATQGHILDTVLHAMTQSLGSLHPILASQAMFFVQTILNFFIASGSGQAVLTMPIMIPLGDLVHVSRQTVILAYQFGEGWGNPIIPTAPVTMGALALAGISYGAWVKWFIKLEVILITLSLLLLIPAYYIW
ncbi:MAG: YfcC family protein [Elusimicrobiaceae bacterium]|nr:YfcC family protein [Elusimicrobiaceae bacterium]